MQKELLDYTLDIHEYDYLVIGTGLLESLYAAHLQKINKKKCLIIDQDTQYSSSIRTLNFKEFSEFIYSINPQISLQNKNDKKQNEENQENHDNTEDIQKNQEKKEIQQENKDIKQQNDQNIDKGMLKKEFKFEPVYISQQIIQKNKEFEQEVFENGKNIYRRFNIDLQPKILFSTSLTVDMMRQADMDKYMDFKAIQAIYHYDNKKKKFILAPSSKGDIFKHKDLGLKEKKDMFNILHKCVKLFYIMTDFELDQNSIEEFDKDFQVDDETKNKFQQYKDEVCTVFLKSIGCSEKVMEIFMYTICNFEFNIIDWEQSDYKDIIKKECTTQKFLGQVAKFIRSCGVHTKLPYLYTCYGTGDIPQGFSRISAVFGGQFILNPQIAFYDTQLKSFSNQIDEEQKNLDEQKNEEKLEKTKKNPQNYNYLEISTNLINEKLQEDTKKQQDPQIEQKPEIPNPGKNLIIKEGVVIGQEFRSSYLANILQPLQQKLQINEENHHFQQQLDQKQQLYLLRVNLVAKLKENQSEKNQTNQQNSPPIIMCIPPGNQELKNQHPVNLFMFDSDTNTCHKDYVIFQIKTVITQEMAENNLSFNLNQNQENQEKNQLQIFVDQMVQFLESTSIFGQQFEVLHVGPYLQKRNVFNYGDKEQVENVIFDKQICPQTEKKVDRQFKFVLTDEENFELDMDRNFEEFRRNISKISDAFNMKEFNYFQTLKEQNGEEDYQNQDSDLEEDGLTKLINKFDDLKNNQQEQPEQPEQSEQKEQNQEITEIQNEKEIIDQQANASEEKENIKDQQKEEIINQD